MLTDPHFWTAVGYFIIPVWMEIVRLRMRWKPAPWQLGLYWGFAVFVLSCGIDHLWHTPPTAIVESIVVWGYIAYALWALVFKIKDVPFTPEYEDALFDRVAWTCSVGKAIWYTDGTLRMDNVARTNIGIPELPDGSKWMDVPLPYAAWADCVVDGAELLKAQTDIAPALATGGPSNQLIRYKNGKVVQGFGTSRANGYAWAGFNLDSTELYDRLKLEAKNDASKITLAVESRRQAEVARLQSLLRDESASFVESKLRGVNGE